LPDADRAIERARERDMLATAVREAGALALKTFQRSPKQWRKGASSVVCEADIAVDDFLRRRLAGSGHGYGWLSEETEDDPARLAAKTVWIVDPIDGTRSYLADRPDWVISAALTVDGRPVIAAVYAPVSDELFLATAGGGATRNAVPIAATSGAGLDDARIGGPKRIFERLAELNQPVSQTPRIGSLALRLVRVAHGELDAAFAGGASHDWDLAAADLLVHEAGGVLTDMDGQQLVYNRPDPVHGALVAAGRVRHAPLLALLRERPAITA
jgi:myo-inositol-1(or 4)-monophosphatase